MEWLIFFSSLLFSQMFLIILAYKCRINCRLSITAGIFIGSVTGGLTLMVHRGLPTYPSFLIFGLEIVLILFFTVLLIIQRFYRDPERDIPTNDHVIVSPADGTVRYIKRIEKGEIPFSEKGNHRYPLKELTKTDLIDGGGLLIGIEMNVLNVHVNRAPIEGEIIHQKSTRGPFLSLRNVESLFENERVTTIIENGVFRIGVIQIASRMVRRIISYLTEGDRVSRGQRIGMITFGSQVDCVIPGMKDLDCKTKVGDEVKAGSTIIAEYGEKNTTLKK